MQLDQFSKRYEREALPAGSVAAWQTTRYHIEAHRPPATVGRITAQWVSRWQAALARTMAPNSVATYSARLRAALRWAERQEIIGRAPYIRCAWERAARSDAVTPDEFQDMLDAIPTVRPHDAYHWRRLLRGQYESGLRIGELLRLTWDVRGEIVVVEKTYPMIHFRKQKNKQRQWAPVLPAAWEIIADTPTRAGLVFPVGVTAKRAIRVVSAIGKAADVVTNQETGKHATSHDVRRAFAIRAIEQFGEAVAQKLMRHAKRETTLTWYDTRDAEHYAELLWSQA